MTFSPSHPDVRWFLGAPMTPATLRDAADLIAARPTDAPFAFVTTPNAQAIVRVHRGDRHFAEAHDRGWLVLNDSRILSLLADKLFGEVLPTAAGSDLTVDLLQHYINPDDAVTMIGGSAEVERRMRAQFRLQKLKRYNPPMGFYKDPVEIERCVDFIIAHPARYVFLVVGAPQSETVACRVLARGGAVGTGLCVGSSLQFATGVVRRAPVLFRRLRLESLYRHVAEPTRACQARVRRVTASALDCRPDAPRAGCASFSPQAWLYSSRPERPRKSVSVGAVRPAICLPGPGERRLALPSGSLRGSGAAVRQREAGRIWRAAILLLALPLSAQCFQYMVDIPALYALSKVWPLLMLPLFAWGLLRLDVPLKLLQISTLVWIIGVTPFIGILQLGNGFIAAFATTAKVWSYTYVFSIAAMLVLLQPSADLLRRVLLYLGACTLITMSLLWIFVPASAYGGGDEMTKLFMVDVERGYRIYMPVVYAVLLIFYLNRSFWMHPRIWKLIAIALAFVLLLTIYKERAAIAAAALTVVYGAAMSWGRGRVAASSVLAVAGCVLLFILYERSQQGAELQHTLGNSLAVRGVSVATAWRYLSADPVRWLLGVGATTRFGDVTLARLFGNAMFYLTDIGWLGVIFEYGLIGAVLMLVLYVAGWRVMQGWARKGDAMSFALADYVVYLIIVSAIYSVVFTPGELTTMMALAYYFRRVSSYGAASPQPSIPMPRHSAIAIRLPSGKLSLPAPSGMARSG